MKVDQKSIDAFFEKAKRLYREKEPKEQAEQIEDECDHSLVETHEGFQVCTKCGILLTDVLMFSFDDFSRSRPIRAAYDRSKHFQQLMLKLNGDFFGRNKRSTNTIDVPKNLCIKDVRKWIREKKLNAKNDFYYWRISNSITCKICSNDKSDWTSEFKQQRKCKAKDFLFKKIVDHELLDVFVPLLQRKGKK